MRWLSSKICGYWFYSLLLISGAGCWEPPSYQEKEITLVVRPLGAREKGGVSAPEVREVEVRPPSREELRQAWKSIQRGLAARQLTPSDLAAIAPQAGKVAVELAHGDPRQLAVRLQKVRSSVASFRLDRSFLEQKGKRTRALLEKSQLSDFARTQMEDRLSPLPRLLDDGHLRIANEVLTEIQLEMAEAR